MKPILTDDMERHRHEFHKIDLHGLFKEFTSLKNITADEQEFIDAYFGNINSTQRINSRQVAAMAMTTIEALVCMGRQVESLL